MKRTLWLWLLLAARAFGAPTVSGDVVVVDDTTGDPFDVSKHPGAIDLSVCAFGAQGLYQVKPNVYDAVFVFTTHPMTGLLTLFSTPAGNLVRQTDQGVAYGSFLIRQPPSAYGSAATLKHCVFAGSLAALPAHPDDPFTVQSSPFGGQSSTGVTGIGMLGHEFGHHWGVYAAYDKGDGRGPQALFRGNTREDTQNSPITTSNLHWSALADTHSVMFGNFITDNQDGTFTLAGGDHRYGYFDQYLMGLRSAAETPPLLVIDDGSGLGSADYPVPPGQTQAVSGDAVSVSIDDVIRADGPRVPAYPDAQRCFRAAFVLVTQQGHVATPQEIALVDAYRQRWESWFAWATDARGSSDTRLDATDACPPMPPPDAGNPEPDAGVPEADAGAPDAGSQDDAGTPGEMLGPPPEDNPPVLVPTTKLRPGCGCEGSPVGSLAFALLIWVAAWRGLRRWL